MDEINNNEQQNQNSLVLRTEGLVKRYGKRTVANGVSINVKQGEIDRYSFCHICGDDRVSLEYRITVECGILVANLQEHFLFDAANEGVGLGIFLFVNILGIIYYLILYLINGISHANA